MDAKKMMTKKVYTLKLNASLYDCIMLFSKKHISGAPVVDRYGRVVGAVSESDVTKAFDIMTPSIRLSTSKIITLIFATLKSKNEADQIKAELMQAQKIKVKEFMSKPAVIVHKNAPLFTIIKAMTENNITRVPVVDDKKKLLGLIARADIIRALAEEKL